MVFQLKTYVSGHIIIVYSVTRNKRCWAIAKLISAKLGCFSPPYSVGKLHRYI